MKLYLIKMEIILSREDILEKTFWNDGQMPLKYANAEDFISFASPIFYLFYILPWQLPFILFFSH